MAHGLLCISANVTTAKPARFSDVANVQRASAHRPHVSRHRRPGHETKANRRGFTLVEMMIVVVIVSILATMAIFGYRKMIGASHMAEANHMVNAIRVAQEAYRAESGTYLDLSASLAANQSTNHSSLYPHVSLASFREPGNYKVGWGGSCNAGCNTGLSWSVLPIHADGATMFGYTTRAGLAGTLPGTVAPTIKIGTNTYSWPSSTASDWYVTTAVGDTNGNGTFCTVVASSFTPDLTVDMDGE